MIRPVARDPKRSAGRAAGPGTAFPADGSATDELREREERFRLMVEGSEEVFFFEHDRHGRFIYLSPSITNVLGYRPDELLHQHYGVLFAADAPRAEVHERTELALQSRDRSEPYTVLLGARNGETVVVEVIERPMVRDGVVIGLQGFARDITQRIDAERRLRESEERFRSLIENSSDTVTILDARGAIRFQSASSRSVIGFEAEALVGKLASRFIHPDDLQAVREGFTDLLGRPGTTTGMEFRWRHRDGSWRTIAATAQNRLEDPAIDGIVVNARNVTERRILEEQFRQAQKMEAVGRLAGGVAHDFNNIITAIRGHVDMVLGDVDQKHRIREDIEEIARSADRAAALTRQLLAFSRRQVLRPRMLNVNTTVTEMEGMLRRLIGESIRFDILLEPGLSRVQADPGQLQQVVMNLVVNARDAMPGGGRLGITTSNEVLSPAETEHYAYPVHPGHYVRLAVSDTGEGMDPQTLDQIFDPFFTTKALGKGTGLGLSTVYGIVKQSGGYIWASSEPGEGTMFEVYLPKSDVALEAEPDPEVAEPPRRPRGTTPATILVVEDEPTVRRLICRTLRRQGYTVVDAEDGKAALELLEGWTDDLDLVLTDVIMPDIGGLELGRIIQDSRPDTRVLYMSGYAEDEVLLDRGVFIGSDVPFLEKPFAPADLVTAVEQVLRHNETSGRVAPLGSRL